MEGVVQRIAAAARTEASPEAVLGAVFVALTDEPRRHERSLLLTTGFTLHTIGDAGARRAWAAQQRSIREALVTVVDEAIGARGITLPMTTEQFVRVVMALTQGSMTQRLIEPGALEQRELERVVLPVLLGVHS